MLSMAADLGLSVHPGGSVWEYGPAALARRHRSHIDATYGPSADLRAAFYSFHRSEGQALCTRSDIDPAHFPPVAGSPARRLTDDELRAKQAATQARLEARYHKKD